MSAINSVSFRGETVSQCPTSNYPAPQYAATSFKAYPADSYEGPKKKKHTGLKILGSLAVIAGAVAGLGLSHGKLQKGWYQKVGEKWYGKTCNAISGFCETACNKVAEGYQVCADYVTNLFHRKK